MHSAHAYSQRLVPTMFYIRLVIINIIIIIIISIIIINILHAVLDLDESIVWSILALTTESLDNSSKYRSLLKWSR